MPKLATIPAPRARCACLARGSDAVLPWPLFSLLVAFLYPLPWQVRAYPFLSLSHGGSWQRPVLLVAVRAGPFAAVLGLGAWLERGQLGQERQR